MFHERSKKHSVHFQEGTLLPVFGPVKVADGTELFDASEHRSLGYDIARQIEMAGLKPGQAVDVQYRITRDDGGAPVKTEWSIVIRPVEEK